MRPFMYSLIAIKHNKPSNEWPILGLKQEHSTPVHPPEITYPGLEIAHTSFTNSRMDKKSLVHIPQKPSSPSPKL
jgi:hypothetical protein